MNTSNSLEELYRKLKPALRSKVNDLNRIGIGYINASDIWNYLKNNVWCKSVNLTLADMVNDIMTLDSMVIANYIKINKEKEEQNDR